MGRAKLSLWLGLRCLVSGRPPALPFRTLQRARSAMPEWFLSVEWAPVAARAITVGLFYSSTHGAGWKLFFS